MTGLVIALVVIQSLNLLFTMTTYGTTARMANVLEEAARRNQ